ncbi:MAG: carboxylating nicotinate-nucleotide diphosphorylase [Terracidiphilus sp.]|jgi:nicotinate-nucleotide pyrophosphorylase (carboxylating)
MDWKSHRIDALLEQALVEDQAARDATTHLTIDANLRADGSIIAREELVVVGLGAVPRFFEIYARLDPSPEAQTRFEVVSHPEIFDGVRVHPGQVIAVIRHNARVLLSCERVILNLLQHLSGIATLTRRYADAIEGTHARVLDTRKTVPGLRALEKYAVLCGGGTNHRIDLASGFLIKNNHIALGGGIAAVLQRALAQRRPPQRVQVEVRTEHELDEALAHGAEAILLDNMSPAEVRRSVARIKKETGKESGKEAGRWIPTEASGGIVLENIRAYAETGVDFISVGALTHSARAADISMSISAEPGQESVKISRGFQGEGL